MLTVVQIRALKPAERPYKVADVDGLYLLVQPSGALLWRFRYRCCGIGRPSLVAEEYIRRRSRRGRCARILRDWASERGSGRILA